MSIITYSPRLFLDDQIREFIRNIIFNEFDQPKVARKDLNDLKIYIEKKNILYLLIDNNRICGTIGVMSIKNKAILKRFYIEKRLRGKRLGSLLFDKASSFIKKNNFKYVSLYCDTKKMKTAYKFYLSKGFETVKERKDGYALMRLNLMKSNLTAVIPTLNNTVGLTYLLNYFKKKQYEVVVVDNKKKNLGFAGGVNKGARDVKTKWMLIMNDDIEFPTSPRFRGASKNYIDKLIDFAEKEKLDAVSPVLRNSDGKVENYGYKVLPYGRINLFKDLSSLRVNELDGLTAACLLIKTEVFKKLGGFDESFFAYLEDVDFFLRLTKMYKPPRFSDGESFPKPRRFAICPDVEVLHNHMTTSSTMGNFKARQDMINWWRLYFKHPNRFKFNLDFIVERLRNLSGYLKATFKNF